MGLWAQVDDAIDVESWTAVAQRHGVLFRHGEVYAARPAQRPTCVRLGFSFLDEKEIGCAVVRMSAALQEIRRSPRSGSRAARPARVSRDAADHAGR